MLSFRLQRTQLELHKHRTWLNSFVAANHPVSSRNDAISSIPRTFITTSRQKEQQVKTGKRLSSRVRWQQQNKKQTKIATPSPGDEKVLSVRGDLLKAIQAYDIEAVINLYPQLPERKPLSARDVTALAQCIHQCLRQELYKIIELQEREQIDKIVTFALQLVKDIRKERLMPSKSAHRHLLGVFKDSGTRDAGIDFWCWLENQDDDYVSLDVYSVALELLAIDGSPLDALEDMYRQALSRFPGGFSAYHLSPNAIVPDRQQEVNIKGLPMSLFRSMTFARLLRGDSKNAYLALDTAFRLFPTSVPQRFLTTFLEERPVSESYTIFAMACRAGIQVPSSLYRGFLAKLRLCSDLRSTNAHTVTLRVMLASLYMQLGSSGTLTSNSISELIITLTQMLRLPVVSNLDQKERKSIVDAVLIAIRQTVTVFARYAIIPSTSAFNAVITNLAGYGKAKEVIDIALSDMKVLNLQPNDVTRRSLLSAAGLLKDPALVKRFWQGIEEVRREQRTNPDIADLAVLAKAARMTGNDSLAMAAWDHNKQHIDVKHVNSMERILNQSVDELETPASSSSNESAQAILEGIAALQADLDLIDERTKGQPAVQDFSNQDLSVMLLPLGRRWKIQENDMRAIYDQVTSERPGPTEPATSKIEEVPTTAVTGPKISVTNISFDTLRYENWKAFNYLLYLAEQHDQEYDNVVDKAIAAGVKPPARNLGFTTAEIETMRDLGLSTHDAAITHSNDNGVSTSDARKHILRLRDLGS